jgi:abortive infection Abi-like protein
LVRIHAGEPNLEIVSGPGFLLFLSITFLNNLGSIGHQLAELRNQYGTGHGRSMDHVGLPVRHAKLAIGAAAALAVFLYECHEAKPV